MLKSLKLKKVGPCSELEAAFAPRLNLITGDNGLGKSFLLDIAWWALTRRWPRDLNKKLTSGDMARPVTARGASIEFAVEGKGGDVHYTSAFSPREEAWTGKAGRPWNPGLVLYAMADGSFAVWDPARNYWKKVGSADVQERVPAYVFGPRDVWDGLNDADRGQLCNGLVADWAGWQKEAGAAYGQLQAVLKQLSSADGELLTPGPLTCISLDDARDIPTLQTPYGKPVPVLHASAGVRRIVALAYLLVWSWQEHRKASELLEQGTTAQVVFLIDEIEAHLHPRWQRSVVAALLDVMNALAPLAQVQLIVATHSPLVMASVEPQFDARHDAWFDLDLVRDGSDAPAAVELRKRPFVRLGDAALWLTSEAFDLPSAGSIQAERLTEQAAELLARDAPASAEEAQALTDRLARVLGDTDPFWARWRQAGALRGWWPLPVAEPAARLRRGSGR